MKYYILLKEYIRHGKSSFISTFLFIFIITISLCAVMTVLRKADRYERGEMERLGYGTVGSWVMVRPEMEGLERQIRSLPQTRRVVTEEVVIMEDFLAAGRESINPAQFLAYEPDGHAYQIYQEATDKKVNHPVEIKEGEVYIPPSFRLIYQAAIGDEIVLTIGEKEKHLRIAGYFEDPIMGSAVMGIKTMLLNGADLRALKKDCLDVQGEGTGSLYHWYHIFMGEEEGLTAKEFQQILNEETELKNFARLTYTQTAMQNFMLILHNIFSGFLLVFLAVLLVITLLVMSHHINAAMEQDYVDIGILKAVGFRNRDIWFMKQLQYLLPVFCGIIAGVPMSIPVTGLVNRLIAPATGIMVPAGLAWRECFAALSMILVLFVVMVLAKTAKTGKVTPVLAIRGGRADVYFKSRLQMPIGGKGLPFHLALRQITSGGGHYISTFFVTALLVFFLTLSGRLDAWMGEDGSGLMQTFEAAPVDFYMWHDDAGVIKEVEQLIRARTKILKKYQMGSLPGAVNHMDYVMNVISEPEYYQVYRGRSCLYKNEAVITDILAEELEIAVGDHVTISCEEQSREFIVTGIYQCANDMGANFGISMEGYRWLCGAADTTFYWHYELEERSVAEEIKKDVAERYGDDISIGEVTWSGMESVRFAMTALEIVMYVISVFFILIVVVMTGNKIFYRERHDIGILKAVGFSSGSLRTAFAMRFVLVSAAGSAAGIVLSEFLTDPLVGGILKLTGVGQFESRLSLAAAVLPAVQIMLVFFVFAYLVSHKIKRVTPVILISE